MAQNARRDSFSPPLAPTGAMKKLLVFAASTIAAAWASPLLPCAPAPDFVAQLGQFDCLVDNPGGSLLVSNSTLITTTFIDTPVNQRVDQYSTMLIAIINGTQTVFSDVLPVQISDPSAIAAILSADGILTADHATFGSPQLISTSVSQIGSQTDFSAIPQQVFDNFGNACGFAVNGVMDTVSVSTTTTLGPVTIPVGPCNTDQLSILPSQTDINVENIVDYFVPRTVTTTNTFLTSQTFEIDGATDLADVPEPATAGMILAGGLGLALLLRKRTDRNIL
jgi:hypothetical protein